jgi:hypothetical protein
MNSRIVGDTEVIRPAKALDEVFALCEARQQMSRCT